MSVTRHGPVVVGMADDRVVDVGVVDPAVLGLDELREAALLEDRVVAADVGVAVRRDPERSL